jgi:hypothetical protein
VTQSKIGASQARETALVSGRVETVADVEKIVEPFVQHHVDAPATIELRAAVAGELTQLVMRVPVAAGHGFGEPCVVVDPQD